MNIVIVGAGEVGTHIASQLVAEQKDVVIIEKDPACYNWRRFKCRCFKAGRSI